MGTNQGATIEQLVPWLNKLLQVAGMFDLPPNTNASNVLDRLETLFSQIDGMKDDTVQLGTSTGYVEHQLPEPAALSNRLRPVTPAERAIQNRAAELARSRQISYFKALEIVRGIRG